MIESLSSHAEDIRSIACQCAQRWTVFHHLTGSIQTLVTEIPRSTVTAPAVAGGNYTPCFDPVCGNCSSTTTNFNTNPLRFVNDLCRPLNPDEGGLGIAQSVVFACAPRGQQFNPVPAQVSTVYSKSAAPPVVSGHIRKQPMNGPLAAPNPPPAPFPGRVCGVMVQP